MTTPTKPTTKANVRSVVHTLLEGLHSMSKSETVIGDAYTLGDATVVPVHRMRVVLGAGGVQGGAKQDAASGESGALGAGGAVQIEPVAVIAVGRDGVTRIMCVESENDAAQKLLEQLPSMLSSATKVLSERVVPIVSRLLNRGGSSTPAIASSSSSSIPAIEEQAQAAAAPALLPSKS